MTGRIAEQNKKYKIKNMFLNDLTSIKAIMIYNCFIILGMLIAILYLMISNTQMSEFILNGNLQKKGIILISLLIILAVFLGLTSFFAFFLKSKRRFMRHYALISTTPTKDTDKKQISKQDIKKRIDEYKQKSKKNREFFLTLYFLITTTVIVVVLTFIFIRF